MKRAIGCIIGSIAAVVFAWHAASCQKTQHQGVFEAGNPGLRGVVGSVPSQEGACLADHAAATDTDLRRTEVEIGADCAFSFDLPVEQSYALSFFLDGVLVAQAEFDGSEFFLLEEGDDALDLGLIHFEVGDTTATPEFPPPSPPIEPPVDLPSLFGIYHPGTISGLACLPTQLALLQGSDVDVEEDAGGGLLVTLAAIVMTGDFPSPGYFDVSGSLLGGTQLISCEGPISLDSDQWTLNATCAFTLPPPLSTLLGTCLLSDYVKTEP